MAGGMYCEGGYHFIGRGSNLPGRGANQRVAAALLDHHRTTAVSGTRTDDTAYARVKTEDVWTSQVSVDERFD